MKTVVHRKTALLIISILLFSLIMVNAQEGSRDVITKEYNVASFTGLEVGNAFEIILSMGDNQKVSISDTQKNLDKISVDVNDGVLMIKSNGVKLFDGKRIVAEVTCTDLQSLRLSGAAILKSATLINFNKLLIKNSGASETIMELHGDELSTDISGAAVVKLSGEAKTLKAEVSGAADLKAKNLKVEDAIANVSGAGNAYVDVSNALKANISGAGSVKYSGNPETTDIIKSGSADISSKEYKEKEMVVVDVDDDEETVKVKVGNMGVEVIEGDDTTTVSIGNHKIIIGEDGSVRYSKCKKSKFNGHWAGIDLGVNGYLNENGNISLPPEYEFLDLNQAKSWTVALNPFEQNFNLIKDHFGLITGIGFQWMNYRFDKDVILVPDSSTIYGFKDPTRNYTKSKLNICYLNVPLLLEYQTNNRMKVNSFHITAGMVFGLRIGSHSKMVFEDSNKQKIKNRDDFHLYPFKMDATVRIGWGWLNLFGTYSMTTLFKEDKGPELYPFTAGITLVGW